MSVLPSTALRCGGPRTGGPWTTKPHTTLELAEAYDAVYADVGDEAFWRTLAAGRPGGPAARAGCGTGRVLLPLARAGHEITGLDLSAHMLEVAQTRLASEPDEVQARVTLVEGDMTSFELGTRFGAILCTFNSFHHLRTVEQQLGCLTHCREHLIPNGILVLDLFNPDPAPAVEDGDEPAEPAGAQERDTSELTVESTGGRRVRRWMSACEYDRSGQCNECEMTYEVIEADGTIKRLTERFPLRLIYRYELEHLLARCGFRISTLYGDYSGAAFSEESLGMIVVAERV